MLLACRFYNLRVAVKGQIRTAPTAVTWVNSLLELAKSGDKDLQGTLNSWNAQAPKSDKVSGQKYLTVKNLLELPAECRNTMFAYINKHGWSRSLTSFQSNFYLEQRVKNQFQLVTCFGAELYITVLKLHG